MALNEVTLTGTLGAAAAGAQATLTPAVWTEYPAGPQTLPPGPQPVVLDQAGHFSVSLTATDNSGLLPSGWYWSITYTGISGVAPYGFSFYLPYSGGATQDISGLDPLQPVPPVIEFMLAPSGTPVSGQVPVATGDGQASAWGSVLSNPMTTTGDMITGGASGAAQRLPGNSSAGRQFLLSEGTGLAAQAPSWTLLQASDIPSLNYDPSGAAAAAQTAAEAYALSLQPTSGSPLPLASGGTGLSESTATALVEALGALLAANNLSDLAARQTALNNLIGSVTAGQYPRGNGSNVVMSAIQAADVPTLNQSTTGTAANITDTLDQVPAPAANVAMASHKLTGLANGSASSDSAAFGQIPVADTSAADIQPFGTAAAAGSNGKWGDSGHVHLGFFGGLFGNGSDGVITLNGSTTPPGFSLNGSTYTYTRDIQATSLTVNSGVTLQVSGWRFFCRGPVIINGILAGAFNNGTGANSSGNGGNATTADTIGGGLAGGAGATGTGANGGGGTISAAAGNGGAGNPGAAGNAGTAISANFALYGASPWPAVASVIPLLGASHTTNGGSGGGGGGGDGTNFGGGGGSGGAIGVFACYSFTNNGTISFPGGNGGSPAAGNAGGGGGGAGGILYLVTLAAWVNSGTATFAGGSLGTGHGSGANGSAGSAGQAVNVVVS